MADKIKVTIVGYIPFDLNDEAWKGCKTPEEAAELTKEQVENGDVSLEDVLDWMEEDPEVTLDAGWESRG